MLRMVDIQNKTEKAWNSPLFDNKLLLTNFGFLAM